MLNIREVKKLILKIILSYFIKHYLYKIRIDTILLLE